MITKTHFDSPKPGFAIVVALPETNDGFTVQSLQFRCLNHHRLVASVLLQAAELWETCAADQSHCKSAFELYVSGFVKRWAYNQQSGVVNVMPQIGICELLVGGQVITLKLKALKSLARSFSKKAEFDDAVAEKERIENSQPESSEQTGY
ncbi:hypothetical protein [Ferrimonas marina]|uniref:Uncharacterized protein n=1 Tax=Ferrimonas marina TaxID=299255 RepID=A0A1M5TDQ9_9GAMM|nr:hypothetical protein [Ferrimonas marina]SHH48826.1 hypothetical protein SAMN02745129_2098 [Ferrimonas marina]